MVSALVLSTTSCFFSWVYHFMGKKVRVEATDINSSTNDCGNDVGVSNDDLEGDDDSKNPRLEMRRFSLFTEKSGNTYNYSQVKGNDDMSGTELLSEEAGKTHGEIEVEIDGIRESKSNSSRRVRSSQRREVDEKNCRKKTFSAIASELKLTIIGLNPYDCRMH